MKAASVSDERVDTSSLQDGGLTIYGTEEAGKFLHPEKPIKPKTLDNWRHRGMGPRFLRIGGRIGYFEKDLLTYLESRRFASTSDYTERKKK